MIVVTEDQVAELVDEIAEKLNALAASGGGSSNLATGTVQPSPPSGVTHLWLEPVAGGRFKLKAVTGV